ncbi:MAG: hypothetical protein RSB96_01220 [Oscillospiraceae bacterium]
MNFKIFITSAIITTILIFSCVIVIIADFNTRKSGFGESNPLFHIEKIQDTTYSVFLFGVQSELDLTTANTSIKKLQSNFSLLPTTLYLASQLYTSFIQSIDSFSQYLDEKNFIHHVLDEINPYL